MQPKTTKPNPALLNECQIAYDWWSRLASGQAGSWLMFSWAFAEAIFWPIIPDFLLVPLAVANRRRFYRLLTAAIVGSALGGSLLFLGAAYFPVLAWDFLGQVPLVYPRQIEEVRQQVASEGIGAFVAQPWSGISFKVWAVAGGSQGLNPALAILVFTLARAFRMALFGTLARLLGGWQRRFVRDFSLYLTGCYLVLFFYEWWQIVG